MFCRGCGAELREGAQFCPKCGRMVADAGKGKGKKSRKKLVAALSIGGAVCIAAVLFVVFGLGFAPGKDTYVCTKILWNSERTDYDEDATQREYDSSLDIRGNCIKQTLTHGDELTYTRECSFDGNGYATSCRYEHYYNEGTETLIFDFQNDIDEQGRIIRSIAKEQHGLKLETMYTYFDGSDTIESIGCACSIDSMPYDSIEYYSERFGEDRIAGSLPSQVPYDVAYAAILDVMYDGKSQGYASMHFSQEGILLSISGNNAHYTNYGEPTSLEQRKGQPFSYHRERTGDQAETTIEEQWDENGYISFFYSTFGPYSSRRSYTYDHVLFPSRAVSIFSRLHYL